MKTKWHKGPPPEIGWWPASRVGDKYCIRWWNGKIWSCPATQWMPAEEAARVAKMPSDPVPTIAWTDRWWL
jgi:hypothetical protein